MATPPTLTVRMLKTCRVGGTTQFAGAVVSLPRRDAYDAVVIGVAVEAQGIDPTPAIESRTVTPQHGDPRRQARR